MKKDKNNNGAFSASHKYRGILITFALDVLFAVASYWLARTIIFFSENVSIPTLYDAYELAVAAIVIIITIAMLVFFDCYGAMWRYAGRVEFFKFLLA
ncbi:MAG: hypothetical protein OSJ83_10885, partial [Clostridia bacterium]|nr:hypothetical protein [Clostridia bacterium]